MMAVFFMSYLQHCSKLFAIDLHRIFSGVAQKKEHSLTSLKLKENPLILIAEAPEKPGNIGALARTVDAAKADALIIANSKTDLYNSECNSV